MLGHESRTLSRQWDRVRRLSERTRQRVRSWPVRASNQGRGLPIPPGRLIYLVAGTEDVNWFLDSGALAARSIREVLGRNGLAVESFGRILDFGCGVGRVLRQWDDLRGPELLGVDYNPQLVAWCRDHLPFARVQVNTLDGGLGFEDGSIDFCYALSVFTHLSAPLQRHWMEEVARVLRPGGHFYATIHGIRYLDQLSPGDRDRFLGGEMVEVLSGRAGSNDCAAFHPESYVRATLARGFDVVDFLPGGALGNPCQDVYLLRKPLAA